jgi:hypothetical protein
MKKALLLSLIGIVSLFSISSAIAADEDKSVAQGIKEAQSKAVVTKISTFNGVVTVKTGDKTVELTSGEAVETLGGVMEKKPIGWPDVAAYEKVIANQEAPDPRKFQFTRWVLENIQTRRINRVLDELKGRLKTDYQKTHNGKIPKDDILTSYLPGKTVKDREKQLGDIIEEVAVGQLGLDPTGPLTFSEWRTKLVTSTATLHDVDVKKLCELAGLVLPPTEQVPQTDLINDIELPPGSNHS